MGRAQAGAKPISIFININKDKDYFGIGQEAYKTKLNGNDWRRPLPEGTQNYNNNNIQNKHLQEKPEENKKKLYTMREQDNNINDQSSLYTFLHLFYVNSTSLRNRWVRCRIPPVGMDS